MPEEKHRVHWSGSEDRNGVVDSETVAARRQSTVKTRIDGGMIEVSSSVALYHWECRPASGAIRRNGPELRMPASDPRPPTEVPLRLPSLPQSRISLRMCGDGTVHVGVLGGTKLPTNVEVLLENLGSLLESHPTDFTLDLVIRADAAPDYDGYRIYDPGIGAPDRALDMFTALTPAMLSYVSDRSPDVLFQVTEFAAHGFATVVAGQRADVPTIARIAGDDFNEYKLLSGAAKAKIFVMRNLLGRVPLRLADEIVVLGPHVRSELAARGRTSGVHELPQPVDRDDFHPVSGQRKMELREELDVGRDERVLLSVGRLTPRKGMDDIPEVVEGLADAGENYRWLVLGGGPLRDQLEATPVVDTRGTVPHSSIAEYYKVADLFVHPSRVDGLPNVLLEATACGVPSIARDVGECSLVATRTFDVVTELRELVTDTYEPGSLDDSFEWDTLRDRYADLLIETADAR